MKKTFFFFFLVLVLKGLVGFIEPFNFSFFSITGRAINLNYCDIERFALEMNRDHSAILETVIFEVPQNRAARTYTGLGNRLLEGTTEPLHQDPGERSSDPTGDCPELACGCLGVSGRGGGWREPAAGLGELSVAIHGWDLLRKVTIIFITLHHSFSSVQSLSHVRLFATP